MKSNTERLRCHDQDVLNYLFKDSKLVLPIRYNVLNEYWFDLRYSISWEFDEQILEAQAHPAIIHFTGIPGNHGIRTAKYLWKKEFDKYKAMSPWRDEKKSAGCH